MKDKLDIAPLPLVHLLSDNLISAFIARSCEPRAHTFAYGYGSWDPIINWVIPLETRAMEHRRIRDADGRGDVRGRKLLLGPVK